MEAPIRRLVEHVFNNWTALQMAVEHSMGGPDSRQIAMQSIDYMIQYLTKEPHIESEDIEDILEDTMDQEFNTICEDNSIKEIAKILHSFLQMLTEGETEKFETEFKKLPVGKQWIVREQSFASPNNESSSVEIPTGSAETQMDTEWTQVKARRKR